MEAKQTKSTEHELRKQKLSQSSSKASYKQIFNRTFLQKSVSLNSSSQRFNKGTALILKALLKFFMSQRVMAKFF